MLLQIHNQVSRSEVCLETTNKWSKRQVFSAPTVYFYMLSWAGGRCSNSLHNFRFYFLASDVDWQDARTCAVCVGARQRLGCGAGTEEVRERLSVYPCRQPPLHTPPPCYLLGLHARHNLSPCSLSSPLYFRVMEISVAALVFFETNAFLHHRFLLLAFDQTMLMLFTGSFYFYFF